MKNPHQIKNKNKQNSNPQNKTIYSSKHNIKVTWYQTHNTHFLFKSPFFYYISHSIRIGLKELHRIVRKEVYLGAHGDSNSICELFHALKHQGSSLNPESDVFSSIVSAPVQPTTNLNHTKQNTSINKERFRDRDAYANWYCGSHLMGAVPSDPARTTWKMRSTITESSERGRTQLLECHKMYGNGAYRALEARLVAKRYMAGELQKL